MKHRRKGSIGGMKERHDRWEKEDVVRKDRKRKGRIEKRKDDRKREKMIGGRIGVEKESEKRWGKEVQKERASEVRQPTCGHRICFIQTTLLGTTTAILLRPAKRIVNHI